jgi:hypothetical protein
MTPANSVPTIFALGPMSPAKKRVRNGLPERNPQSVRFTVVQEYDVTPQGGVFIRLAVPTDRQFRMARTRARGKSIDRHMALSNAIVEDAQSQAAGARAWLTHIRSHLAV